MDEPRDGRDERTGADEPPPIGGSWGRLYAFVMIALGLLIVAFTAITRHFA
ncbi:MAG: hypothetical protein WC538_14720 [Thermoanaerobaculia bacterium]|jgi:hypothetical protein